MANPRSKKDPLDKVREKLIEKYLDLKVEIRMEDAESCTSYAAEFRSLYRNGTPRVDCMSNKELREAIAAAKESLKR